MKKMFKDVKKGDKVWSFDQGWGEVLEDLITDEDSYPVIVEFDNEIERFTIDGKSFLNYKYPVLFWDEIIFVIPKKPLPF